MSTAAVGVVYIVDTGHATIVADVAHIEDTTATLISSIGLCDGIIVVFVILSVSRVQL